MLKFSVKVDVGRLLDDLPQPISASVVSTATTRTGLSLFRILDEGRGPVRPVRAKALMIPLREPTFLPEVGGTRAFIFRMFSRATKPLHLTKKAVNAVIEQARVEKGENLLTHSGAFRFLNRLATAAVRCLRDETPSRTGRMQQSYEIKEGLG